MKSFFTASLIIFSVVFASHAEVVRDTTIVEFSDTTVNKKVTIISTGTKEISLPVALNLNNVLRALGIDSTERERAIVLIDKAADKRDTLLVISPDGRHIQIISKENLEPKTVKDTVLDRSGAAGKKEDPDKKIWNNNSDKGEREPNKNRFFPKTDLGLYLGLNALANEQAGPFGNSDLRMWRSRYVALSFRRNATLLRGVGSDLALSYGPEIAWYNFMFQNSNSIMVENGTPVYKPVAFATEKTKLVVPALNFPVMLNLGVKKDKFIIGAGGYVGYRIGGYTKTKDQDGNKEKLKGDYELSRFIYGLTAELGRRNGFTLFFRYDLNTLFDDQENRPNTFNFGVRF
jgi:hypothetical protein